MSTKKTLTITAIVFVVGMSGIVLGLPSIPQVAADEPSQYGRCNQATIANDLFFDILDPGKELADHRKDFCTDFPHP